MTERPQQPPVAPGFEHINRYWDPTRKHWAAKILPGEFYVTAHGEPIATVLGSCISVCIRDTRRGIGGMNHFMLPEQTEFSSDAWGSSKVSSASRYGNWAMEYLINEIMKLGGHKSDFEIKVFGGGQVLTNLTDVGQRNILFAYQYIQNEGFTIAKADVGDIYSRKVIFFPDTGRVLLKRMSTVNNRTIISRDQNYLKQLRSKPETSKNIELF